MVVADPAVFVHVAYGQDRPAHVQPVPAYAAAEAVSQALIPGSKLSAESVSGLMAWIRRGRHIGFTYGQPDGAAALIAAVAGDPGAATCQ